MTEAAQALSAAESALAGGDAASALALLGNLEDPAALHLRAVAYRRAGRLDEARRAFMAARAAAPDDPFIANNFANLLRQMGAEAEALRHYDHALALRPDYRDAAFNKALLLSAMGEAKGALALLDRLAAAQPGDARAQSARGAALRQLGRHGEAAAAYDAALLAQPGLASALKGRAQLALERGEKDASARYRKAVAADPADLGALHGFVEALEAEGSEEGVAILQQVLWSRPDWIAGHELLARMQAERGDADCTRRMRDAAARDPGNHALAVALARTLAAADRWDEALAALPHADDPGITLMRASFLSESGDPSAALALIGERSLASPESAIPEARAHFRLGDPQAAARVLERAVTADPAAVAAWGLLELAWRMLDDPRAHWLSGQPGLFGTQDLGLADTMLAELRTTLAQLHRTRAHPIGQSLRGGTQTRGALLLRTEPILGELRDALAKAIAGYVAGLPPADVTHPLLRHRDRMLAIGGSWSVRLTGSGFHVNHIHPEGVLSSAFYVVLPNSIADNTDRAGWLELGRPPGELGLALEPLAVIEPRVGRLALFPSYLFHGTRPFPDGERLTVAFDVVPA